jgi:hypothetical protein
VLLTALFLLGLHSTLFGPVKYAILPQHLRENELVGGNALVEAGTFVAILIGTLAGGLLAGAAGIRPGIAGAGLVVAVLGYLTSRGIPRRRRRRRTWWSTSTRCPKPGATSALRARTGRSSCRSSAFPGSGSTAPCSWPSSRPTRRTCSVAARLGDAAAGDVHDRHRPRLAALRKLSAGHVEIGLVPFGSIGLTLFGIDLAFASPRCCRPARRCRCSPARPAGTWRVLFDLFALGLFGGFFIVPLYALIQIAARRNIGRASSPPTTSSMRCSWSVGALAAAGLLGEGLSIPALFGVAALCNAAVAIYIYSLVPEFMLRFIAWLLIHSVYRLRRAAGEHPAKRARRSSSATMSASSIRWSSPPRAGGRSAS